MSEEETKKKLQHWFDTLEEEGVNLSTWEMEFVASVKEQFERRGTLSDKQIDVLERIYADKTS
jgi:hypothetical protein